VFVLNLPASIERRQQTARAFNARGVAVEFVDAVDGHTIVAGSAPVAYQPHLGRALTRGEVGCLESHLAVLQRIVEDGHPLACVCEDDIRLSDDSADVFQALATALANGHPHAWDVLLLGHHSARHTPEAGAVTAVWSSALTDRRQVARVAEFAMGAYAYVVTRRGAERLLAFARPLRMPMDWVTGYSPVAGVRLFAVTPPCVTPDPTLATRSTIDGRTSSRPQPTSLRDHLRATAGHCWLGVRRLGLWPNSFVRRH